MCWWVTPQNRPIYFLLPLSSSPLLSSSSLLYSSLAMGLWNWSSQQFLYQLISMNQDELRRGRKNWLISIRDLATCFHHIRLWIGFEFHLINISLGHFYIKQLPSGGRQEVRTHGDYIQLKKLMHGELFCNSCNQLKPPSTYDTLYLLYLSWSQWASEQVG